MTTPQFGGYKPAPDQHKTMDDFWRAQGWYKKTRLGLKFVRASWERKPELRREAVRVLVDEALRKDPHMITKADFVNNRLHGLLNNYYDGSRYKALRDAGYEVTPWQMDEVPKHFFERRENRIEAIRWLADKLMSQGRFLQSISSRDFKNSGLESLLNDYYDGSPYRALRDAGYKIERWQMRTNGAYYKKLENRTTATGWLARKVKEEDGREPRDITAVDFRRHHLGGMLNGHHHNQPYRALLEALLVTPADESYMRQKGIRKTAQTQREI